MLSSINPLGERARGQRFWLTAGWYVFGSLAGGLLLGAIGGGLGSALPSGEWRIWVALVTGGVGAAYDFVRRSPPSIHRQVDEDWLSRYRGWAYGLGFGFQLGFGMVTIVTSASFYSMVAITVLSGDIVLGGLLGAVFGLVRAAVIGLVINVDTPSELRRVMRDLQGQLEWSRRLVILSQVGVSATAMLVLAGVV